MPSQNYLSLQKSFDAYSSITEELLQKAQALHMPEVEQKLKDLWIRLQQGPIRVLVLGSSSAGKSTLVNAAVQGFVAPEGDGRTSPIPVWIRPGRVNTVLTDNFSMIALPSDGEPENVEIIPQDGFLSRFRYLPPSVADGQQQTRFQQYEAVDIHANNEFLLRNFTLIDTPGIDAVGGEEDEKRTRRTVGRGAEMVIFVYTSTNISATDRVFFQETLDDLGNIADFDVSDSLFVVNNPKVSTGGSGRGTAVKTDAQITFGVGFDTEHHLFMMSLLHARFFSTGRPYPYSKAFPPGIGQKALKEYIEVETKETTMLHDLSERKKNEAGRELTKLLDALEERAEELCEEPDTILAPIWNTLYACITAVYTEEMRLAREKKITIPEELQRDLDKSCAVKEDISQWEDEATLLYETFCRDVKIKWAESKSKYYRCQQR